jgi:hypothetical protein
MTGSDKVYSAPRLETLSLRATRDINLGVHLGLVDVDVHIGGTLFS